ncbi:MAG: lamin tail domain-containing protein [Phycisphaerales bacterium]|nr:lamin tail domain-containing protein [Phycisphaerales bacterium]
MRTITSLIALTGLATAANAQVNITEWMYSGGFGEFVEFTNTSNAPVDMTGWSYDDDSRLPGGFDLSGAGTLQPGESFVICEETAADFITVWGLAGVTVLGEYTNNLGRNDEINLFDNGANLIDRLTYGDENFPGSIRAQNFSGNPLPGYEGANDVTGWVLSANGDTYGSWTNSFGDVGNPGVFVPAPASAALLGLGALIARRRR